MLDKGLIIESVHAIMVERFSLKQLLHPRYGLTWLGVGVLWLIAHLPWSMQMVLGKVLGLLMYYLLQQRRKVGEINIRLAFPELSQGQQQQLLKKHFVSLGQGLLDSNLTWLGNKQYLMRHIQFSGLEHLENARAGEGLILLTAHFTSMEMGAWGVSQLRPLYVFYRPYHNPVIEWLRVNVNKTIYTIQRDDVREMIRALSAGAVVWYAQDQNFGHKNSVFAPFFNVPAATNTATSRISRLGKASVIPFFAVRTASGYKLQFYPALENFPSKDVLDDTIRINQVIEQHVRLYPEHYLWTHRRYKDRPEGGNRYK